MAAATASYVSPIPSLRSRPRFPARHRVIEPLALVTCRWPSRRVFGSDRGVGSSGIKGNNNVSFSNKSWVGGTLAWESKAMRPRHANKVLCMSVQQASKSKVSVALRRSIGEAKEPPLNTYKPKEPYTATIVSVERLVGPKAPGETCHMSLTMVAMCLTGRARVSV